jgi:hypothetical protein
MTILRDYIQRIFKRRCEIGSAHLARTMVAA